MRLPIRLLTFVLQEHHCDLLEDWFSFFDYPIAALIVYVGPDPTIRNSLEKICIRNGVQLEVLGVTTAKEVTLDESSFMSRQFDAVPDGLGCVVRLDTLPFKAPGVTWQDAAIDAMNESSALYITGSTKPYRGDRPLRLDALHLTQRVSNCFLLISPSEWRRLQQGTPGSVERYGRFAVEGAAEDYLKSNDLWGIRLLSRHDIRIFHTQEWSPRIFDVRRAFHAGKGIDPYICGYADDEAKDLGWRRYYMYPIPPLSRRIRISLGAWRRKAVTAMGIGRGRRP